jgi:hypothetical protein
MIEIAKHLTDYLEQEKEFEEQSRQRWSEELKAAEELASLYGRLTAFIRAKDALTLTLADLFLIAQNQLYGAVSLLLRRRSADAELLTRRAIESAAITNRLFRHPDLLDIFARAHDGIEARSDPKQWQPSKEFKEAFATAKLFSEPEEFWRTLRLDYDMLSVMAAHAGLGATTTQHIVGQRRVLLHFEANDKDLDRVWYHQLALYFSMLRVFFASLRETGDAKMVDVFAQDILSWRHSVQALMKDRVPWLAVSAQSNAAPGPAEILVVRF